MSRGIGTVLKIAGAIGATAIVVVVTIFVVAPDLLFGGGSTSATEAFLRMKNAEKASANRALGGDTVCLLPAGIPPTAVLGKYQKTLDRGFYWDSDMKWYVVILRNDSDVAKLMHVNRSQIDLSFEQPVCSTNLVIVVEDRDGMRRISANHESPTDQSDYGAAAGTMWAQARGKTPPNIEAALKGSFESSLKRVEERRKRDRSTTIDVTDLFAAFYRDKQLSTYTDFFQSIHISRRPRTILHVISSTLNSIASS